MTTYSLFDSNRLSGPLQQSAQSSCKVADFAACVVAGFVVSLDVQAMVSFPSLNSLLLADVRACRALISKYPRIVPARLGLSTVGDATLTPIGG